MLGGMIRQDGFIQFVGTVGVSGGTADQDVLVGEARVKAV